MSVQTLFYPNDYTIYADTGIFNNLCGGTITGDIVANNITVNNSFTAPGNTIDNTGLLTSDFIIANNGVINNFISASGTINNFNSVSGSITNFVSNNSTINNLSAGSIISNSIVSSSGYFVNLGVNQEIVRNLSAQNINSVSGSITNFLSTNATITNFNGYEAPYSSYFNQATLSAFNVTNNILNSSGTIFYFFPSMGICSFVVPNVTVTGPNATFSTYASAPFKYPNAIIGSMTANIYGTDTYAFNGSVMTDISGSAAFKIIFPPTTTSGSYDTYINTCFVKI